MSQDIRITSLGSRISTWGEGPLWWNQSLYYVDIEGKAIIKLNTETQNEQIWQFDQRIGCLAPIDKTQLLYAGDTGIYRFNTQNGESTFIADPESDLKENRFNDGKCDPMGRFWAGTISLKKIQGTAALYCLDAQQSITQKLANLTNSNGLAWSADATRFFHIDTPTRCIHSYQYDNYSGSIQDKTTLVDTQAHGFDSSPDGMTIDREDNLWVAFCHGGCVAQFDSKNGALIQSIELPVVETTACTFGGHNLDRLFVTTGIKKDLREANAGKVFVIDGLKIQGQATHPFKI
jgi:sugar lactone lactonase YvrE